MRLATRVENQAMRSIAILDDYNNCALSCAPWSSLGEEFEITVFNQFLGDEDQVATALADFEIVVAMRERTPFPASLLRRLPQLRLLITSGMRNLAFDMAVARELDIPVCGTATLPYPAFEHTWALILALLKNIPAEDRCMRDGGWQAGTTVGLRGNTLGVLGLGKLGAQVATVGLAFGMRVIAWSENLKPERAAEIGVELVSKATLLAQADVVSIHLLLSERTRGLLGAPELAAMKPSAYLVNTSRGPIVDEAALLDALQAGRIAGAGLDVYDIEPLPADHPLRATTNTVLTGHTAYGLMDTYQLAYSESLEDIQAWLGGEPIRVLNP